MPHNPNYTLMMIAKFCLQHQLEPKNNLWPLFGLLVAILLRMACSELIIAGLIQRWSIGVHRVEIAARLIIMQLAVHVACSIEGRLFHYAGTVWNIVDNFYYKELCQHNR